MIDLTSLKNRLLKPPGPLYTVRRDPDTNVITAIVEGDDWRTGRTFRLYEPAVTRAADGAVIAGTITDFAEPDEPGSERPICVNGDHWFCLRDVE